MTLQEKIIAELGVKPSIDPKEEIRVSVDFLNDYLKKHSFLKSYVLGISGGQDSSLAGRLAQIAVEEFRAETGDDSYKFIAVRLPYGVQTDEEDAQRALKFIQPDVSLVVNIKEGVDGQVRELEKQLGHELLRPAGRGLELTPAGRVALQQADQIFQLGEQLPQRLRSLRTPAP